MKNIYLSIALLLILASCSSDDTIQGNEEYQPIALSVEEEQAAIVTNEFAWNFFTSISGDGENNVAYSPMGLQMAMLMIANGANGETRDMIMDKIFNGESDIEALNSYTQKIVSQLAKQDKKVALISDNSLWSSFENAFKPEYSNLMSSYFDVECHENLGNKVASELNKWCSKKTNGAINDFVGEKDNIILAVINLLSFDAKWKFELKEENTVSGTFFNANGARPVAKYMELKEKVLQYKQCDNFGMVEIPYGNEAFSYNIILPNEESNLNDAIAEISEKGWDNVTNLNETRYTIVHFPRFEQEFKLDLSKALTDFGVGKIFENDADLSNMTNGNIHFSKVLQQSKIQVNEDGTKVVVVTGGIALDIKSEFPDTIIEVNRPFIYFIREKSTGCILYLGIMANM